MTDMAGLARLAGLAAIAGLIAATAAGCSSGPQPWGGGGEGGPVVVSADGRELVVDGIYSACGSESTLVAGESTTEVALSVSLTVVSAVENYCERASPPLKVRLAAPLGKRKLVDADNGRPALQFSARLLLRPRTLPPGYRPWAIRPVWSAPVDDHPVLHVTVNYAPGTGVSQASYLYQLNFTEYPDSRYVPGPWQCVPKAGRPAGGLDQWGPVRVRGVWGCARAGMIAWRQHGLDYLITIDYPVDAQPPLSTAQFVAIADSATEWTGPLPAATGPA